MTRAARALPSSRHLAPTGSNDRTHERRHEPQNATDRDRVGYRNAGKFGGDQTRTFLSGHWKALGLPADLVTGGVLLSGIYDLKPVRLSARSRYVHFDDATEAALSPQRHLDRLHARLVVAYASLDTPEFQRQSRDFSAAVKATGKPIDLLVARDYNHYEAPETLANPYGLLGRAALAQMDLT